MFKKSFLIIIAIAINSVSVFSQQGSTVDSLVRLAGQLEGNKKLDVYIQLCWELRNSDPEHAISYGKKAIELANTINNKEALVKAYSFTGVAYRNTGNYPEAFDFYFKGLELAKKYNITEQQGYAYINLANLYLYQKNAAEALSNLKNALEIASKIQNQGMISYCYLNMGRAEILTGDINNAEKHFLKSLEIRKAMDDKGKIAVAYKYLADVYADKNDFSRALAFYNKSLNGIKRNNDLDLLADIYNKIAVLYLKQKEYAKSKKNTVSSLRVSKQIGSKLRIRNAYQTFSEIYAALADYRNESHSLKLVLRYNDSLFSQQLSEKILNIQYSMEQERKQHQIDVLNAQKESQNSFIIVLGIALLLGVFFLIISLRLNLLRRKTNKLLEKQKENIMLKNEELNNQNEEIQTIADSLTDANLEISLQKEQVEKSHAQITSSINYAKRIQSAILPDINSLNNIFPEHLIVYKAKNIVSGDFYWVKQIRDYSVMAVADCTGHGVPGAFLSMLGITLLNEIVRRDDIANTSTVLNQLREQIKLSLKQTGKYFEQKDGMDMAICAIDSNNLSMLYSGANNPAYIVRANFDEGNKLKNSRIRIHKTEECKKYTLIEIKPDRQPIGSYIKETPFTDIEFSLKKNDTVFLFSDGYYDQFNGETGKKFNNGRFRNLILSIAEKPLHEQQKILNKTFTDWKKNREQVDDVLVLGVRI